jgi:hypothetical protein
MNKRIKTSLFAFASGSSAGGRSRSLTTVKPRTVAKKTSSGFGGRKPPSKKSKPTRLTPVPRKNSIDFEMMHKIVVSMNKKKELKKSGATVERVEVDKTGGLTHGDEMTMMTEGSKTVAPNVIGQGQTVKNKNEMITGSPSTKGILLLKKINSSITRMMWNTKLYSNTQYNMIPRDQLVQNHGFNTKCWWVMPGCAAPGYRDVLDTLIANHLQEERLAKDYTAVYVDTRTMSVGQERKYASLLNFKVDMAFTNESNYLPVKLKLMYIIPKNSINIQVNQDTAETRSGYMWDFQNFVLNGDTGVGNQRDNAIPVRYQLSKTQVGGIAEFTIPEDTTTVPPTQKFSFYDNYRACSLSVQVATAANLNMSPYFRENFTIAKSFTRTLDPNDVWNFKHIHNFGSGIELDQFKASFLDMNQNSSRDPSSYLRLGNDRPLVGFWVVESMGVPCTCLIRDKSFIVENPLFDNPYQGTSNGTFHCEIKSSMSFVGPLQNTAAANQQNTGGVLESVHMRVFKKRDFVLKDTRMVRHVLPENMVLDKDDLAVDKGIITVYTESSAKAAGLKEYVQ